LKFILLLSSLYELLFSLEACKYKENIITARHPLFR